MANGREEDKKTLVLDLTALTGKQQKQEEELQRIAQELEFNVEPTGAQASAPAATAAEVTKVQGPGILLFDYQTDFFHKSLSQFPKDFFYQVVTSLTELNQKLKSGRFHVVVFNYDAHPKAANQLCKQIKEKFPEFRSFIVAKSISPKKAEAHAKTPSGAHGYFQLPLDSKKLAAEFTRLIQGLKKAS